MGSAVPAERPLQNPLEPAGTGWNQPCPAGQPQSLLTGAAAANTSPGRSNQGRRRVSVDRSDWGNSRKEEKPKADVYFKWIGTLDELLG